MKKQKDLPECCKKKSAIKSGILAGVIPHLGCIAIILFAILGVTAFNSFFLKFISNPYYVYIIFLLSFLIAGIAGFFYIRRFEDKKLRSHWKYLTFLFGSIILVNLVMIYFIFPVTANLSSNKAEGDILKLDFTTLPCSGHVPLVISSLQGVEGVNSVKHTAGNIFEIYFNSENITKQEILKQEVCEEFGAKEI